MSDLYKYLQSITMLAQELHITLEAAQKQLEKMDVLLHQVDPAQREIAIMIDEMLD